MTGAASILAGTPEQLVAALWFAAAIVIMDRFDILLPRGDSIGVSGALVVAGVMVAGAMYMAPLAMLCLVVAHVGRPDFWSRRLGSVLTTRVVALGVTVVLLPLWSPGTSGLTTFWLIALPLTYLTTEYVAAQSFMAVQSGRPLHRLLTGNFRRQAPLIAAQASASVLAAITYPQMEAWSLVLVVALLLLMRQSLALLLEIRETYRTTVEVLVEVAEGQDERLRGHGERSAHIARSIGARMGLNSVDLERVSYATLLHDIDALSGESARGASADVGQSSFVFRDTAFFDDVLPALRLCDGWAVDGDSTDQNLMTAMIVALSSDIDAASCAPAAAAHSNSAVSRVSRIVPAALKARVVAAALELGYEIPAVQ